MTARKPLTSLSAEELRRALDYDPETGVFRWREKIARCVVVGSIAGNVRPDKYVTIRINKVRYLAHRLAWLYMTGSWPRGEVDHIDGQPDNMRWINLRDVPPVVNKQNHRRARADSRVGLPGVQRDSRNPSRFVARICVDGVTRWLGAFSSAQQAHSVFVMAKRVHHEGNTL